MMRIQRAIAIALPLTVVFAGCELSNSLGDVDLATVTDIQYSEHVQPLLDNRCTSCHGAGLAEAGLRLDSWTNVIAGSRNGEVLIPYESDKSLIVRLHSDLVGGQHLAQISSDSLTQVEIDFLARWIDEGARNNADEVPYEDATELLYVCNQDDATVSIIDTEANVVIGTVDLTDYGFSETSKPHHAAVEPDGSFWYVTMIGDNVVAKFDRENKLVGQVSFETPGMLALHPSQDKMFVGRSLSALTPPRSIGVITRSDMSIDEVDVFFPRPHAVAVNGDGTFLYSASLAENELIRMEIVDNDVHFTSIAGNPHSIVQHATSPESALMFSSAQLTNQVLVFDVTNPDAPSQIDAIDVGDAPWHPVFTRDGSFVYVGNKDANTVTVIFVDALVVREVISGNGISQPHGSAASSDGRYIYISNRNADGAYTPRFDFGDAVNPGTVVVIDTATDQIAKVLEVGRFATGLGIKP